MPGRKSRPSVRAAGRRFARCRSRSEFKPLEAALGYRFRNPDLLRQALTHASWTNLHPEQPHNERLEFLGDAVLGVVVTHHIFQRYPELPEGQLSKLRAEVVCTDSLTQIAAAIDLDDWLLTQDNIVKDLKSSSILGNAVEAVIGAAHLDGGLRASRKVVLELVADKVKVVGRRPGGKDWKSQLQEYLAKTMGQHPKYEVHSIGKASEPRYAAKVLVSRRVLGRGEGGSKKQAEHEAARVALERSRGEFEAEVEDEAELTSAAAK